MEYPSFKLIIIGNDDTKKTTFVKRNVDGEFEKKYYPTLGVQVHPLDVLTNSGIIRFNCWDTTGQKNFDVRRDGYYIDGKCAIIMFNVSNQLTYQNVQWHRNLCRVCENISIVLCENKIDVKNHQVKAREVNFHGKKNLQYYNISSKCNHNIEKPFFYLAKKLVGKANLHFVEYPILAPRVVQIDLVAQQQNEVDQTAIAS